MFSKYAGVDYKKVAVIVADAVEWGLFDKNLYDKYGILTSKRIQKTYFDAAYRKKQIEVYREFIINGINEYINRDNVVINSINTGIYPQIKLNKNKLNKIKTNKNKHGEFVLITEDQYLKLISQLGEAKTADMIEKLNLYIGSKGNKYKSHYHTILNWVKMESEREAKVARPKKHFENERDYTDEEQRKIRRNFYGETD